MTIVVACFLSYLDSIEWAIFEVRDLETTVFEDVEFCKCKIKIILPKYLCLYILDTLKLRPFHRWQYGWRPVVH